MHQVGATGIEEEGEEIENDFLGLYINYNFC
jgi:hypothetical protein